MSKYKIIFFLVILISFSTFEINAQGVYNRFLPKKDLQPGDTVSVIKNELEAPDFLLEKPIDPAKYILGPGDVLQLNIIASVDYVYNIVISPEGKAIVPGVAIFEINNKTLKETETLIVERTKQKFKTENISLTLKSIRKFKVMVSGEVTKPMSVPVTAADRVSDAIAKAGGLKQTSSLRYITLLRDGKTIPVDLLKYYQYGDEDANPNLTGGDFINGSARNNSEYIKTEGDVFAPSLYEYKAGDSLSTLIKFSQGFMQSALLDSVEFARYNQSSDTYDRRFYNLNNWQDYFDNSSNEKLIDFPLEPGDQLYVRRKASWQTDKYVIVEGEVKYPGHYAITNNKSTLKELISRAGGVTDLAALENAILIRQSVYKEQDLDMVRLRTLPPSEMGENERKYFIARSSEIQGRISIDFKKLLSENSKENDVILRDQDSLYIPKLNNYVNVGGRVNNPGRILHNKEFTYEDYINQAGGYGYRADESATLVVKSKGQQYSAKSKNYVIEPGDNIFVLTENELTFFEVFTTTLTIITQIFTIVAVVLSVINMNNNKPSN